MLWGPPLQLRAAGGSPGPPTPYPASMDDEVLSERDVSVTRAAAMLESGGVQIVDVRQEHEWRSGRITGATHIPLDALPERSGEIARDRPVIFQCRTGVRSAMAAEVMRASGVEALNLEGGLEAWVQQGLPLEPDDGAVAKPQPGSG
jgi:rhodanese-related sulfurtransferase